VRMGGGIVGLITTLNKELGQVNLVWWWEEGRKRDEWLLGGSCCSWFLLW
jgi:hypothetical protein